MDGFGKKLCTLRIGDLFFSVKVVLAVFPKAIVTGSSARTSGQTVFQRSQNLRCW